MRISCEARPRPALVSRLREIALGVQLLERRLLSPVSSHRCRSRGRITEAILVHAGPSHIGFYLCLSHRWGGAKVLQTLMGDPLGTPNGRKGTFCQFQSPIPIESMPTTFRDAIQVTRPLHFRYIGIDSLCIVQDRPSDWEAEAKRMGGYYRNACLTIVAGSALSADSGLFFPITRPAVPCHVGLSVWK